MLDDPPDTFDHQGRFNQQRHDEVKAYLINDLKITEAVYNYALKNKKLKYMHSEYNISFGEREVAVNW